MALTRLPLKYGGFLAAAICAGLLDLYGVAAAGSQSGDIIYRMLGEMREVMSARLFIKADEYYHGGTRHPDSEKCSGVSGHLPSHADHDKEGGDQPAYNNGSEVVLPGTKFRHSGDVYTRLYKTIHFRPAHHLSGFGRAEALPWFYLATRIDPHNINAYVTGGYWLAMPLQLPDEAVSFLQEGLVRNPQAWQIYSQLGDVYFLAKNDYFRARSEFQKAYHYIQKDENVSRFDLRHVLTFLAAAHERLGEYETALIYAGRLTELFPQDRGLKQRILKLRMMRGAEGEGL